MSKSIRVNLSFRVVSWITLTAFLIISGAPAFSMTRARGDVGDILFEREWEGPPYRLMVVAGDDGQLYTRVTADGYSNGGKPGWPSLPRRGELIGVPAGGDFGLELVEVEYTPLQLQYPVEPAPAPAPLEFDASGVPLPGGWVFAHDAAAYTAALPYPAEFAALDAPVWMRDQRLARLMIYPFRYHAAGRTLDVLRKVRLRVVRTGESAQVGRIVRPLAPQLAGKYKLHVAVEGLYSLEYATLAAAGLPVAEIQPATMRLIHAGRELPAQWDGDGDVLFEPGERLLFYARPELTRYAGYDVYWLDWDAAAGLRMASRSGDPTGLPARIAWTSILAEENWEYDSLYGGRDGDHWFWRRLRQPDLLTNTFTVQLETPAAGATGELAFWLHGATRDWVEPDHHVRFMLNGVRVGDVEWEGKTPASGAFDLPAGLLAAGSNTLTLSLPDDLGGDVEMAWLDAITITYGLAAVGHNAARFRGQGDPGAYTIAGFSGGEMHVYDVSDPAAPRVVTGWRLAGDVLTVGDSGAPSDYFALTENQVRSPQAIVAARPYSDPPAGADYIIITHPDFAAAVAPLAARRAAQGLRTALVDVEALYDHFGDGRMAPQAIRAFLAYAYTAWPAPPPLYILLVGDATIDPRHYLGDSDPTYLPAYLGDVDPWMGETASDRWYADLTGDLLPEFRLGRLPVNTPGETTAVVNKIITYETHPAPGDWNRRLVFGADNPSAASDHHADADAEFNTYATPAYGYEGVRIYLSETPGPPHMYTTALAARTALLDALDEGALLYTYFGHSSVRQEAVLETDDYTPFFHRDHIGLLNNAGRWPMVLHMTCFTGYYIDRADSTLDESLLRAANVGAVAVWGASGNGVAPGHRVLHHAFYRNVMDNGEPELGASIQAALAALYGSGLDLDLLETYHLLGDPAMKLYVHGAARHFSIFLPVVMRNGS